MSKEKSSGGFPLMGILFVILVVGKLAGWFSISWIWVFLIPIIAGLIWFIFVMFIITTLVVIFAAIKVWCETKRKKTYF